ncbi:MAG: L-threonylcarbamoyladenylate synthase [Flavobacteriales bacterium]|jgi:L-threonylcarbamoyladenylate synthase
MPIGTDINHAADLLRKGEVVAIPTETVYGLAANAYNEAAVLKIFQAKQRPAFDPLIVHVHSLEQVQEVVSFQRLRRADTYRPTPAETTVTKRTLRGDDDTRKEAEALMAKFWPGPLTLVLPKSDRVPDLVTSGLDTVAVRMPAHPMALELLRSLDFPLAAPSANPFGYVSPTTAQHVADQLGEKIPYILDGGPCTVGVESTIIGWESDAEQWVLYRPGGTPVAEIEAVIGTVGQAKKSVLPASPGTLESHYAPRKPVFIGDVKSLLKEHTGQRTAVIAFTEKHEAWRTEVLSPKGNIAEAARRLFAALRSLDASEADVILAEVFPQEGLGAAINDRLRRASAKRS